MIEAYLPYLLIIFGITIILISLFKKSNNDLKESGIPADGIIFKQEISRPVDIDGDHSFVKDKITVRFLTNKDEWITAEVKQDFMIAFSGQYKNGDSVKIFYDQNDPYKFYLASRQSESAGRIGFAIVGIILFLTGLYQLFTP